ncbi:hypothetical protein HF086_006095 [Spodoptera exigua]|uniref:Uncharacterized protein n=1 Tax=Spodoptera exigua TaxID=7107 RepID=A0A922SLF7_SPOEX|nr:hypothetical protein HF086_006095 [Spodoptera exigua]
MENGLSVSGTYELLTSWKLITAYVKILKLNEQCPERENEGHYNDWDLSLSFGPIILQYLKDDVGEYGPIIHDMFTTALDKMFQMFFIGDNIRTMTLRQVLNDDDFVPAHLVVSKIMPKHPDDETKCARSEILQKLKSNASMSVQVQLNMDFCEYVEE